MAGLRLSASEAREAVEEFRNSNPKIVDLWGRLQNACEARMGGDYTLPLPCTQLNPALKRRLFYRSVARRGGELTALVAGRRVKVYGGLLAENWTQATARDVLASAWLRCADAGFLPVLSVHDELVFELPESVAGQSMAVIKAILEQPLSWASTLPLKVEGQLMNHYDK